MRFHLNYVFAGLSRMDIADFKPVKGVLRGMCTFMCFIDGPFY